LPGRRRIDGRIYRKERGDVTVEIPSGPDRYNSEALPDSDTGKTVHTYMAGNAALTDRIFAVLARSAGISL
jgi:hypothetical protein